MTDFEKAMEEAYKAQVKLVEELRRKQQQSK